MSSVAGKHWQDQLARYRKDRKATLRSLHTFVAKLGRPCYWYHIRPARPLFWTERTDKLAWCDLAAYLCPTVHLQQTPLLYSLKLNSGNPQLPRPFFQDAGLAISWELAREAREALQRSQDEPSPRKLYQWATSYQHLPPLELTLLPDELPGMIAWLASVMQLRSEGWSNHAPPPGVPGNLSCHDEHRLWTDQAKAVAEAWARTRKLLTEPLQPGL